MIYLAWSVALFLLLLCGIALAEDLSKLNSYAVTFGVASSSAENVSKINAYAVVVSGGSSGLSGRRSKICLGSGIN
jgi:hypothetical protein